MQEKTIAEGMSSGCISQRKLLPQPPNPRNQINLWIVLNFKDKGRIFKGAKEKRKIKLNVGRIQANLSLFRRRQGKSIAQEEAVPGAQNWNSWPPAGGHSQGQISRWEDHSLEEAETDKSTELTRQRGEIESLEGASRSSLWQYPHLIT